MRYIAVLVVVTFLWVSLIVCQEEEFHCKPKLGCRVAKCDAVPFGTFGRIEDYLERSEFPISCKLENVGESNVEILSRFADMQKEMMDLKTGMNQMELRIREMEAKIEEREYPSWCASKYNGIKYNGSCLWAENPPSKMSLITALKTCNNRAPSKLPEVYGETEYLTIMEYLRSKIPDGETNVFAWTGMKREHSTGKAVLSNGEYAPYMKTRTWSSEWTNAIERRTHVYLEADESLTYDDQGMGAGWPEFELFLLPKTILCQRI